MLAQPIDPSAVAPKRSANPDARFARQQWALFLLIAQVLTTVVVIGAACQNVISIVVGFPVLAVVGLALAMVVRPITSWPATSFAISAPVVCAAGALMIALFKLNPDKAHTPIATMLLFYSSIILPVAIAAVVHIRNWQTDVSNASPRPWRYSLKSLMALTTAVCIVTAILSFAVKSRLGFSIAFASFALVTLAIVGLIVWRLVSDRRR